MAGLLNNTNEDDDRICNLPVKRVTDKNCDFTHLILHQRVGPVPTGRTKVPPRGRPVGTRPTSLPPARRAAASLVASSAKLTRIVQQVRRAEPSLHRPNGIPQSVMAGRNRPCLNRSCRVSIAKVSRSTFKLRTDSRNRRPGNRSSVCFTTSPPCQNSASPAHGSSTMTTTFVICYAYRPLPSCHS